LHDKAGLTQVAALPGRGVTIRVVPVMYGSMSYVRRDSDRGRFEALYQEHFSAVLAYALARTDRETAKEVVADTFLVAWRRFEEMPSDPRPWLFGVARKVLATHRRASLRREALAGRARQDRACRDVGPEDEVTGRRAVIGALERLRAADREALRLVAWDGLSYSEAATVLGCSRAGFAVRLHRARRRFEAALAEGDGAEQTDDLDPVAPTRAPDDEGSRCG
jgi:RNA polymerase sigma-70 factor (ECF subfamily)